MGPCESVDKLYIYKCYIYNAFGHGESLKDPAKAWQTKRVQYISVPSALPDWLLFKAALRVSKRFNMFQA